MIWNVASARDEISLRKWSVVLRICAHLEGSSGCTVAENPFCWQQCFCFTHTSLHIV